MGRGYVEFQDAKGQSSRINMLDVENIGAVETYGNKVKSYSDAGIVAVGYTAAKYTKPAPGTTSNVDKKGIVIVKDTKRGVAHELTIPSLKTGQTESTPNGDRIKQDVVEGLATAYGTAIGVPMIGLYGYPTQKK